MSPSREIFTQIVFQPVLLCNNQCDTDAQIIPSSQSSWHLLFTPAFIHFFMLFIQPKNKYHQWWHFSKNVTSRNIFTQKAFQPVLLCNNQCETGTQTIAFVSIQLTQLIHKYESIHHQHAIHSTTIKISPMVTFQWEMLHIVATFSHKIVFQPVLLCNNQCETDTQIIPPSQSSWHILSHMHSFTSACYSFNHNRNITSGDISVKMSPVVTF